MWLDDLVTQLEEDGVGTLKVNIFTSSKAAIPMLVSGGATLVITETGGTAPDRTQNATIFPAYLRPGAQLVARANSYAAAREMADAAYQSLVKVRNQFINSGWYREIRPLQEPFEVPSDDRTQTRVAFNVVGNYNRRR